MDFFFAPLRALREPNYKNQFSAPLRPQREMKFYNNLHEIKSHNLNHPQHRDLHMETCPNSFLCFKPDISLRLLCYAFTHCQSQPCS